jgi:hypothetical protein
MSKQYTKNPFIELLPNAILIQFHDGRRSSVVARTTEMSGDPNGPSGGGGGAGVIARTDDAHDANATSLSVLACPKSWQLYFPDVTHDASDRRAELARTMTNFFASTRGSGFVKEVRMGDE